MTSMALLLVTYHPGGPTGPPHRRLELAMRAAGGDVQAIDSTWLINAPLTPLEFRDRLAPHLAPDDRVLIVELTGSLAAHGPVSGVWDWLARQLEAARGAPPPTPPAGP
jgi:hypothetical protein